MEILIHRGSNEIGGTCIQLSINKTTILLDLGLPLSKRSKELGSLPTSLPMKPDAILISHPHQDHFGLIDAIDPDVPVYIGELGKHLIDATRMLIGKRLHNNNFRYFKSWQPFKIGDFTIKPYLVDHSAVDAYGFLIEAEKKRVFYSGDFRAHGRKSILFDKIVNDPPREIGLLFMEGTMIERSNDDFPTEVEVENRIYEIIKDQKNITFLISSSQNIDRIVSAYRACLKARKTLVIDIYTAWVLEKIKLVSQNVPSMEWDSIGVYADFSQDKKLKENSDYFGDFRKRIYKNRIKKEQIAEKPEGFLYLSKMSKSRIMNLYKKEPPINVIYSQWLGYLKCKNHEYPGAEEIASYQNDPQVNFVYAHTSGHAAIKDLKIFANALSPKNLVPIHTEHRETYSHHFKNAVVMEDDKPFLLTDEGNLLKRDENSPFVRMAEIRDKVDPMWITEHLNANKVLLKKMVCILDEVDPESIIYQAREAAGWDVAGEYIPEAKTILLRQSEWKTVDKLAKVIAEEFSWWFYSYDEDGKAHYGWKTYKVAARKIWNAWLEIKGDPPEVFADKIELPLKAKPIIIEVE